MDSKPEKLQLGDKQWSQSFIDEYSAVIDFNQLKEDELDPDLLNEDAEINEEAPSREGLLISEEPDLGVAFPLLTETHPPGGIPAQCEQELLLPYTWYKKLRCLFLLSGNWFVQSGVVRGYMGLYHERFLHLLSFPYTIHPFSNFYFTWQLITCLVVAVSMCYEPFMLTFKPFEFVDDFNWTINLTISLILVVDMVLTFYVGKPDPATLIVTLDPKITRSSYLRGRFIFDLITRFPIDATMIAFLSPAEREVKTNLTWIRLFGFALRLLRLYKLNKFIKHLEKCLHVSVWTIQIINHAVVLFYCIHWGACMNWLLPDVTNAYEEMPKAMSWITHLKLWDQEVRMQYLFSFLRALSNLLTLDGGDFTPEEYEEMLCTLILIVVALSIFGYIISTLSTMIMAFDNDDSKYHEMLACVEQYLRFRRIPSWLHQRIMAYYDKKYKGHWFPERIILESISDNLRAEIVGHNCKRLVEKVYIFSGVPTSVMLNLVQRLEFEICVPGDILLSPHVNTNCMYFIEDGQFRVLDKFGSCLEVLGHGDFFGEVALLCPTVPRTNTVMSTSFAEVYKLTKKSYLKTMKKHPEIYESIVKVATDKIKYEYGGFGDKQSKRKDGRKEWRKIVQAASKPIEEFYADADGGVEPDHFVQPEELQYIYHQYYTAGHSRDS